MGSKIESEKMPIFATRPECTYIHASFTCVALTTAGDAARLYICSWRAANIKLAASCQAFILPRFLAHANEKSMTK